MIVHSCKRRKPSSRAFRGSGFGGGYRPDQPEPVAAPINIPPNDRPRNFERTNRPRILEHISRPRNFERTNRPRILKRISRPRILERISRPRIFERISPIANIKRTNRQRNSSMPERNAIYPMVRREKSPTLRVGLIACHRIDRALSFVAVLGVNRCDSDHYFDPSQGSYQTPTMWCRLAVV